MTTTMTRAELLAAIDAGMEDLVGAVNTLTTATPSLGERPRGARAMPLLDGIVVEIHWAEPCPVKINGHQVWGNARHVLSDQLEGRARITPALALRAVRRLDALCQWALRSWDAARREREEIHRQQARAVDELRAREVLRAMGKVKL